MTRPIPIAPMMADMVRNGIAAVDGKVFENLDRCPHCGGGVRPHDLRVKRFATIATGTEVRDVHVRVKRFRCARCGRLCYADSPFYPGTRHGAPIVELAAVLAERMPPGRTAQTLEHLGIVLDRATVRAYAGLPLPPIMTTHLFGIPIPASILHLSASLRAVAGSVSPLTAPPAEERHQRQEKHDKEERDTEQEEDRAQPE